MQRFLCAIPPFIFMCRKIWIRSNKKSFSFAQKCRFFVVALCSYVHNRNLRFLWTEMMQIFISSLWEINIYLFKLLQNITYVYFYEISNLIRKQSSIILLEIYTKYRYTVQYFTIGFLKLESYNDCDLICEMQQSKNTQTFFFFEGEKMEKEKKTHKRMMNTKIES